MIKETLSHRLDSLCDMEMQKKIKAEKKRNIYYKKVENKINKEFSKARKILGYRFSMKKQYNKRYCFFFDTSFNTSIHVLAFYITLKSEGFPKLQDLECEITSCNLNNTFYSKLPTNFTINDLAKIIIIYIEEYFKRIKMGE